MNRRLKVKFKHYAFQTIMATLCVGTAGMIVFALITIILIAITIASCGSTYSTCPAYSLETKNTNKNG